MKTKVWRISNWVMLALFAFSVAVQYNDPDPLKWMAIYGLASVACFLEARDQGSLALPAVLGAVTLIWAVLLLPDVIGHVRIGDLFEEWEMQNQLVEIAREAGGLLIVAVWMQAIALRHVLAQRKSKG
jgi:hypothetical protein